MPEYQTDPSWLAKLYVPASPQDQTPRLRPAGTGAATPTRRCRSSAIADARAHDRAAHGQRTRSSSRPRRSASTSRPARRCRDAVAAIAAAERDIGMPGSIIGSYSGDAAEFARSLAGQPWLILAAAITIYIVLGVLYESFIHPITILSTLPSAGIGALLALLLCGHDLSVVALIGIILLMGIVKKNAIMMIDFALEAERSEGLAPRDAIVKACAAALPADHDDDAGGAVRRAAAGAGERHRLGAALPARRHHHRRAAAEPAPHALHHAGDLSGDGAREGTLAGPRDRAASAAPPSPPAGRVTHEHLATPSSGGPSAPRCWRSALFLVGAVAYLFLPVASCRPSTSRPSACRRAGRAPTRRPWRRPIAAPLERRLGDHRRRHRDHLDQLARHDNISIQFDLKRNIDGAARDVQAALNAAATDLPGDLPTLPTFRKANPATTPVLILALTSKTHPAERDLRRRPTA